MRVIAVILMALACATAAAAATYDELVARAKGGDTAIDYLALRDAYAASDAYRPYARASDKDRQAMRDAFNAGDCATVLAAGEAVLADIYIDMQAHLLIARCNEIAGAFEKAEFHRKVAHGLMDSIVLKNDGKSAKTAFVVVTIDEEYAVMSALRWRPQGQSLANEDGHVYDVHQVKSANSDETSTLYFQIDRPMAWLSRSLAR
jgi:hypothetical protein